MWRAWLSGVTLAVLAAGQQNSALPEAVSKDPKVILDRAVAQSSRFRELHDPVVSTHALAGLGALVCADRPTAGVALFSDALSALRMLTLRDFTTPRHRLPVASFT